MELSEEETEVKRLMGALYSLTDELFMFVFKCVTLGEQVMFEKWLERSMGVRSKLSQIPAHSNQSAGTSSHSKQRKIQTFNENTFPSLFLSVIFSTI